MDTMSTAEKETPAKPTDRRVRSLTIVTAILAVIALGLGGWLAYDLLATHETDVTADVQAVVDDYRNAWNNYDGEAFLGLVTTSYRFYDTPGLAGDDAEETAAMISGNLKTIEWQVEQIGPSQMVGDDTTVYVSFVNRVSSSTFAEGDGISVLTLVKQDDTWKVSRHIFSGD